MAWHAATTKHTDLVMIPLRMALWERDREGHPVARQLIHHSDAGSQYTSLSLTEHLALEGIRALDRVRRRRVRQRADGDDQRPVQGRVHPHHRLPRRALKTIADVEYATAGWVDWYNNRRLHSTLGNVPPVEYEQAHYAALNREPQPA